MGGFNPITAAIGAASTVVGLSKPSREKHEAQQNYAASQAELLQKAQVQHQQDRIESDEASRLRKNALKRAVAKQQAAFGGQGIDATEGSGEAVMLGLFQESEAEKQYRDRLDRLKQQSLAQDVNAKSGRNLLSLRKENADARDGFVTSLDRYF
ncbi:MAG: hypothetical protein JWM96_219 [Alphaproteobacteria bacterium]|nr:hypothetical protein [Alphaproteobacteria bacterium]